MHLSVCLNFRPVRQIQVTLYLFPCPHPCPYASCSVNLTGFRIQIIMPFCFFCFSICLFACLLVYLFVCLYASLSDSFISPFVPSCVPLLVPAPLTLSVWLGFEFGSWCPFEICSIRYLHSFQSAPGVAPRNVVNHFQGMANSFVRQVKPSFSKTRMSNWGDTSCRQEL